MFVSVKNLTATIEQNIQFYIEGMASKEQHSEPDIEDIFLRINNLPINFG